MTTKPTIKTHKDAVLHFIKKMDADMVSTLLNDKLTYQDYTKQLFIRKLGDLFWEFSQLNDFELRMERGECYGCNLGMKGYTFIGNRSKAYINFVFITDDTDHIIDIYECDDFCNNKTGIRKKQRLTLDKDVGFDLDEQDDYYDGDDFFRGDDDIPF